MNQQNTLEQQAIADVVRHWVETLVVDLNLCPFAKRELVKGRIRFTVTEVDSQGLLLDVLRQEFELLQSHPEIETTLLIHPQVLRDFFDYNDFLESAETLLQQLQLEGIYQIAGFHPDYQFAGTTAADVENYTNRTPYPLLHLIREDSLERAIANYPDPDNIPSRNIQLMQELGEAKIKAMLQACFDTAGPSQ
ncbi:MAG: DUF1415 domain-containing protein [Candidatus Pelagadaptatus aseana]|uniref:DUF1415 domain-containing protein n=1 Tax=Candidatus Pelagadaptatus aseana TaxID=3120508 RepID=UPI0039B2AD48